MSDKAMSIETMIGRKDQKPYVVLTWGAEAGQLTAEQARQLGLQFLAAASATETDAFILRWIQERAGPSFPGAAATLVQDLRSYRASLAEPESGT